MRETALLINVIRWSAGRQDGHMATSIVPNANLKQIHTTLQRKLNASECRATSIILIYMASEEQSAIPPLLHCICPPQATEACIRTMTNKI